MTSSSSDEPAAAANVEREPPLFQSSPAPEAPDTVQHVPIRQAFAATKQKEADLAASFESDVGDDLTVADSAAALLQVVLIRLTPEPVATELQVAHDGTPHGDTDAVIRGALIYIGIRAWRAMRAARALLATGYEHESRTLDRIIIELLAHREGILADPSGAEAVAWLQGDRGHGISARVKKLTPPDMYKSLSHDSHGDPIGVTRLIDPKTGSIELAPQRTHATRASLLMHAGFARDQAVILARRGDIDLDGIDRLDHAIRSRWDALKLDAAAEAPSP